MIRKGILHSLTHQKVRQRLLVSTIPLDCNLRVSKTLAYQKEKRKRKKEGVELGRDEGEEWVTFLVWRAGRAVVVAL